MEGALSAVVSDMRERFGITVNERAYSSNSDLEAALGRGEIDVALPFAKDYWIADQEGYAQSDSLASSSLVALYKGNDLGSALASIAIRPNSIVSESLLKSRYPDADIVMRDNATACFDALSSGRAQAAIIPVTALDAMRSQTGMGMPIVKGFVEKMDGSIDVTSVQGEGSSFCVVLPFEIDRAPERHAGSADAEGECDVSGMRVLLAEDNDLNLEIATTLLADEGVAVTCAANGREAFDTFVDRPAGSFDAILMDIMMPVMDGYEAARAIRRSVKADVGSVPIFAMTANAFAEDAQRAHNAGMNGHLTKPIDMEKVKQALATARR